MAGTTTRAPNEDPELGEALGGPSMANLLALYGPLNGSPGTLQHSLD